MTELPIMRYFAYKHLPEHLQATSKLFHDLAHEIDQTTSANVDMAEKVAGLRKLLEAKDCIVRARI